jgi:6-pyruvoyltetrahydropterin/6-carboxytetrahydropterin synthase
MFRVCKTFRFEAAHRLPDHDGKCRKLHGHSYRVEVEVATATLAAEGPKRGMAIDFGDVKEAVADIVNQMDHTVLNDRALWSDTPPTAEAIAKEFYDVVSRRLLGVSRVRVWETDDSWAEYTP